MIPRISSGLLSLPHTSLAPSYILLFPSYILLSLPPTRFFNQQPVSRIILVLISNPAVLPFLLHFFTRVMAEYDQAPQEADAKQDALEEPGVADTDGEEDAPQEAPSNREGPISSSD